ncbi:hypothetical protein CDL12_12647 [Handroanthus impetiginosus]|uniref:Uncharacterized protein n=1 Tax=Handroanthus impetiginosus TaxID=429701 RepID=A0A2G9HB25_9LAMI|nr:hypothetical protein CDL12_17240 [Handroanthus impetiginosus]PIN14725.1 hypothetical protein CDL12_12647 [Handroanthus impetiginosus]
MQSSTSLSSLPLSISRNSLFRKSESNPRKRAQNSIVYARERDFSSDYGRDRIKGKLVDENMIVLRMRIQDIMKKEDEENYGKKTDKWTDWEREWCKNYESDVFEVVGILQMLLLNSRPSLVIGMVALFVLSFCGSLAVMVRFLMLFVMGTDVM